MRGFVDAQARCASGSLSVLEMMRVQRLSPDCHPLAGVAPSMNRRPTSSSKLYKSEFCADVDIDDDLITPTTRIFDTKPLRIRPSVSPAREPNGAAGEINGGITVPVPGDVILQWGHNKRSRGSRSDAGHPRPAAKRRSSSSAGVPAELLMPPPPPSYTRGPNLRSSAPAPAPAKEQQQPLHHHHPRPQRGCGEERLERSGKRSPDKSRSAASNGTMNGVTAASHSHQNHSHQLPSSDHHDPKTANGLEQLEWPRIYLSLSRKEKEDDFMAMKGSKLPQRPKKRAKNLDRVLQGCFPGTWLSDLTRGRYEVREKKCVKKKRRGLKGMESMDSDSEE